MSERPTPPGAAVERTALAWFRTAVSMAIVGLLMIRAGTESQQPAAIGLGAIVLALAGGVSWLPTLTGRPDGGTAATGQSTGPSIGRPAGQSTGQATAWRMMLTGTAVATASLAALAVLLLT